VLHGRLAVDDVGVDVGRLQVDSAVTDFDLEGVILERDQGRATRSGMELSSSRCLSR
jgi:hypothetical protein